MATLRESIPLSWLKVLKKSVFKVIRNAAFSAGFFVLLIGVLLAADSEVSTLSEILAGYFDIVAPCLLLAAAWIAWEPLYQYLYFRSYFYDMDDDNITIRKGVIATKEVHLPFEHVTDVYVDRDMFDALLGLYDVHISTATEQSGQFAHIDGVTRANAVRLRELILDNINEDDDENNADPGKKVANLLKDR